MYFNHDRYQEFDFKLHYKRSRRKNLSIKQFEELLEDIEDLAIVAERKEEATISHADLIAELKQDDLI